MNDAGTGGRRPSRGTLLIGITGPIGCGKSTVARRLGALGAHVIDADEVTREVLEPGSAELAAVVAAFGDALLRDDGSLDRARLGGIVFADPAALARLESIVHPAVRRRILASVEAAARSGAEAVVIEAIKLVDGGLANVCDEVWLVTCGTAAQSRRLADRGLDAPTAALRVEAQANLVERAKPRATRRIDTSGDLESTLAKAVRAYRAATAAASKRARSGP